MSHAPGARLTRKKLRPRKMVPPGAKSFQTQSLAAPNGRQAILSELLQRNITFKNGVKAAFGRFVIHIVVEVVEYRFIGLFGQE